MLLLPSQKNALFNAIRAAKLNPAEFKLEEKVVPSSVDKIPPDLFTQVTHSGSGYWFRFLPYRKVAYSPGKSDIEEEKDPKTWELQGLTFFIWLAYLRREIAQPDLWTTVQSIPLDSAGDIVKSDEKLPPELAEDVVKRLDAIAEDASSQTSDAAALKQIAADVAMMKKAVVEDPWKKALKLILGNIVSWLFGNYMPKEWVESSLRFVFEAVKHLPR